MDATNNEPLVSVALREPAAQREQEERLAAEAEHALAARPRVTIGLRISLSMLLCFVLVTGVVVASMAMISRVSASQLFLEKASTYALEIEDARRLEKNYLLYGSNVDEAIARVETALHFLRSSRGSLAALVGAARLKAMEQNLDRYRGGLEQLARASRGAEVAAERAELESRVRRYGAQAVAEATDLIDRERVEMHAAIRTSWQVAVSSLLFILIAMSVIAYALTLQVARPLRRFVEYTQRIAGGDYSPIRPARRYRDEVSQLAIAINRMVFRLKEREAQLTRTSRMAAVGTLTAGIAHELNNPLNNIGLNSEALLNSLESYPDEQKRKMLHDITNQVERASATVRNLLDFTRVEKPIFVSLSLAATIHESQRLLSNEAELNNVVFDVNLPQDLPRIEGNPRDVQQVFLNLLLNAIQAMPDGGTVSVQGRLTNAGDVEIEVADTGVGIPEDHLGLIFDPFFTSKEVGTGTGLGLFVTYGIIERHHGKIAVTSKVGEGTTFTVTFPVAPPARTARGQEA